MDLGINSTEMTLHIPGTLLIGETASTSTHLAVDGQDVVLLGGTQHLDQLGERGSTVRTDAYVHTLLGFLQGVKDAVHVGGLGGFLVRTLKVDGLGFGAFDCGLLFALAGIVQLGGHYGFDTVILAVGEGSVQVVFGHDGVVQDTVLYALFAFVVGDQG